MADNKHLYSYAEEIEAFIKEIATSELDVLDEKKSNDFILVLKYYKQRWINELVCSKSKYDLDKKTAIINSVTKVKILFNDYMRTYGNEKLKEKHSSEVKTMFESILNKENNCDIDFDKSIDTMMKLREHIINNPSKYNDIQNEVDDYIYKLFKMKNLNNGIDCNWISNKITEVIIPKIADDARQIIKNKYENKEEQSTQNEIRMFLTLNSNSLDLDKYYLPLLNLILSMDFADDKTIIEEEIIVDDYDLFYKELLNDLEELKKENYGLYTYSLIYIYYARKELVDNIEFISRLKDIKQDILKYRNIKESNLNLNKKFQIINKINESNTMITRNILDKYKPKNDFEKNIFYEYINFENYKTRMLNGNLKIPKGDYIDYKDSIILFSNLLIDGFFDESILEIKEKDAVFEEITKLVISDEDMITLWKLNSYIRLIFGKEPNYINMLESDSAVVYRLKCRINFGIEKNIEIVNKFFSNMILLAPITGYSDFQEKFANQVLDTINALFQYKGADFQPSEHSLNSYRKEILNNNGNSYAKYPAYQDCKLNPYYKDFELINESCTKRQSLLKTPVKIKKLRIQETL